MLICIGPIRFSIPSTRIEFVQAQILISNPLSQRVSYTFYSSVLRFLTRDNFSTTWNKRKCRGVECKGDIYDNWTLRVFNLFKTCKSYEIYTRFSNSTTETADCRDGFIKQHSFCTICTSQVGMLWVFFQSGAQNLWISLLSFNLYHARRKCN